MSVPGNINTAPPPSSFDNDPDFYQESRWGKFRRRLFEEPLIPLGCALTCWALYEATKSIKIGDKHRTNRMFRRRIYAQGFTILAMFAGSIYWEGDRKKRTEYNELVEDKLKKDRHEAWLKELEIRDEEEQALRRRREKMIQGRMAEQQKAGQVDGQVDQATTKPSGHGDDQGWNSVRSVLESSDCTRQTAILAAVVELWNSRSR